MKNIKISRISKAISLFIVLSALAALAATTSNILYQKKGVSEFIFQDDPGGNGRTIEKLINDFDVRRHYIASTGDEELYLISSKKKITDFFDAEGVDGHITWEVRRGERFETKLWGKTEQATELNVHWAYPMMVTGLQGCCAELTGYRMYDLRDGKFLMSFNDFSYDGTTITQPYSLSIPNSNLSPRFIGVTSQDSKRDRDFAPPPAGKEAAALIMYANENLKQKVQVDMTVAPGYGISVMEVKLEADPAAPNSDKIELRDREATLWNIDGSNNPAEVQGVQLKIVLNAGEGDKTLIIPVKNDQLDLSKASLPIGVSINAQR
ncbi:hypothetical protein AZI86_13680 [Bdellovibrio bacteriovorus]|uniref:Uncharacterized protein n=1 Tax=Bdellovibrio bacteriovorus TaxID=959 RepID=A0A150WJJ8_BDEBC|nr:hypothetical protein [Bdellovibrio bacteriovorus]KYG63864.1 hypothetical protein AZI86_13680 [Bdellovibrio bacteriovorus]